MNLLIQLKKNMKTPPWFNRTPFFSIVRLGTAGPLILSKVLMRMRALATIIAVLPVANVAVPAVKADPTAYLAVDLVSDQPGVAAIVDPSLVNAWGIALSSSSPFWCHLKESALVISMRET
jgi:hypothetical protein